MWSLDRSNANRLRVAVLAGGRSPERAISLQSGTAVCKGLEEAGHRAALFDPADVQLAEIAWGQFDACFIALHGGAGEDGRLQRRLELLKMPYTGSGPDTCRLAMSKSASKERFRQAGLPTPDYELFDAESSLESIRTKIERLGLPVVIKPDSQGSSLGVSIVRSREGLAGAIAAARQFDPFLVAEKFVDGREFSSVLLEREPLPLIEIVTERPFFDHEAKFGSAQTDFRIGARISSRLQSEIEGAALSAARALGLRGLVQVDLLVDEASRPWLLEVNAVPGMTSRSLAPKAATAAGLSLARLCERLVRDCLPLGSAR